MWQEAWTLPGLQLFALWLWLLSFSGLVWDLILWPSRSFLEWCSGLPAAHVLLKLLWLQLLPDFSFPFLGLGDSCLALFSLQYPLQLWCLASSTSKSRVGGLTRESQPSS